MQLVSGIHSNGSVWLQTSAFIVPSAEDALSLYVHRMLPFHPAGDNSKDSASAVKSLNLLDHLTRPIKAAQISLQIMLFYLPSLFTAYHLIHLLVCLPSLESNLHPDEDSVPFAALFLASRQCWMCSRALRNTHRLTTSFSYSRQLLSFSGQALCFLGFKDL